MYFTGINGCQTAAILRKTVSEADLRTGAHWPQAGI